MSRVNDINLRSALLLNGYLTTFNYMTFFLSFFILNKDSGSMFQSKNNYKYNNYFICSIIICSTKKNFFEYTRGKESLVTFLNTISALKLRYDVTILKNLPLKLQEKPILMHFIML